MIEEILKDTTLRKVDGKWTLFYKGKEYMRLLDATSREDAEQQVSEMLFVRAYGQPMPPAAQSPRNNGRSQQPKQPKPPSRQ